jgi:TldD protein
MANKVNVALIDRVKDSLSNLVLENRQRLKDCSYIDLRVGVGEGQGAAAQDGMRKFSLRDYRLSYGLRVIAGKEAPAAGYFGQSLGAADVDKLPGVIEAGLERAHERAMASSEMKRERQKRWEALGQSLHSTELAPVEARQDTIAGVCSVNPVDVPLEEVSKLAQEVSKAVASYDSRVKVNQIMAQTSLNRELFVSSEGANLDRTYALTQGFCVVVAIGNGGVQQTHYDSLGHQRGWEILTDGIDEELIRSKPLMQFALDLAADNVSLSEAKPCPSSGTEVVVVTDPHYNTLLVHEIIGHPTELDRALKLETAYAGRSWLLRSLKENMLGQTDSFTTCLRLFRPAAAWLWPLRV